MMYSGNAESMLGVAVSSKNLNLWIPYRGKQTQDGAAPHTRCFLIHTLLNRNYISTNNKLLLRSMADC